MKIFSWFKRWKMRSKITAAIVLVVLLSGMSILAVLYQTGKIGTRADTTSQFVDLNSVVQARSETATACNKDDSTCPYQVSDSDLRLNNLAGPAYAANYQQALSEAKICLNNVAENKTPADLVGKSFTSTGWEGADCFFDITKVNANKISVNLSVKNNQNIASSFPLVYKTTTVDFGDFSGNEKLTSGNVKYNFNLTSIGTYSYGLWLWDIRSGSSSNGNINAIYEIDLEGNHDLLAFTESEYPDFVFDPSSYWKSTTTGTLKGFIDMDWTASYDSPKYSFRSVGFCPDDCKVTLNEEMNIKATKKGTSDNVKGTITSKANHSETYDGIGAIDPVNHKIYWQDLIVNKNDNRSWSHDLTYSGGIKAEYSGVTSSEALIQPIKNLSIVSSQILKSNQITTNVPLPIRPQTYQADINKFETSENNKLVRRTGTGSFSSNVAYPYSGIYDLDSPQVLVKESLVKTWIGTRRDPFSEQLIPQYSPEYFPAGGLRVPGYFTATSTDATKTILSTPAQKVLPKNFVFLESFADGDGAWSDTDKKTINKLIDDLKARGVTVTTLQTKSKQEMLDNLILIPSGSWVLNAGHGTPDGLRAGNDFVSYAEIMRVLKQNQIKIDVYAADSCFGGRAPLSQTVIGSMGIGYVNTGSITQPIGNLFGISGSIWNATTDDIVSALNKIAKQNAQAAKPPAIWPPLPPWMMRR